MVRGRLLGVVIGVLAGSAFAQDTPPERPARPERQAGGEPRVMRPPGPDRERMSRMFDRIAQELNLDDDQKAQFDEIVARHQEKMGENRRRPRGEGEDQPAEGGGRERRERMGDMRGMNPLTGILEDLDPILRDDQREKMGQLRERFGGRGRGGDAIDRRTVERMADDLDLDESQREQLNQMVEALKQQSEEQRGRPEDMGQMYRELRDARDAGDDARAKEIEEQLQARRPDRDKLMGTLFEQVEGILREDQRPALVEFRRQTEERSGRGGDAQDYKQIYRTARRLKLNDDQKDQLREMEKATEEEMRDTNSRDRAVKAETAAKVKHDIIAILDADQVQQFEKDLQRLSRREGRDGREGRSERRPRSDRPERGEPREGGEPDRERGGEQP